MIKKVFKNKKTAITTLSVLLLLCVVIGSVSAYLAGTTDEKQNVFTLSENIRAKLIEPNWNQEEGYKMVPGKQVRKDPMIVNQGDHDEYAAIRLIFEYQNKSAMTPENLIRLLNMLTITWNDKWKLYDGILETDETGTITAVTQPLIFYYDENLKPGANSEPIFHSVSVKTKSDGLTEADLRWLQGIKIEAGQVIKDTDGLGEFHIEIEGAVVHSASFADVEAAAQTLKELFP